MKTTLEQAILDHLAFPFLKKLFSTLSPEDRRKAIDESVERFKSLAQQHPEGTEYLVEQMQKMIPEGEPLEGFIIDPQLQGGEGKG